MSDATISPVATAAAIEEAAALFQAYASTLPVDLGYQAFDAEVAGLPGKYAPPRGALLIARTSSGKAIGCVGLRPLDAAGVCEMKRLFVLPEGRGAGLGRRLAQAAIGHARSLGYLEMRLDTLPTMRSAIALYELLGFRLSPAYYAPTPPGTIFMKTDLQAGAHP